MHEIRFHCCPLQPAASHLTSVTKNKSNAVASRGARGQLIASCLYDRQPTPRFGHLIANEKAGVWEHTANSRFTVDQGAPLSLRLLLAGATDLFEEDQRRAQ